MRLVTRAALGALRLPRALEAALPALVPAEQLVELGRGSFDGGRAFWIEEAGRGLFPEEAALLSASGAAGGRALCLGAGAGREAFALAAAGFDVLGVEQVPELVRAARERAAATGARARFLAGDMRRPPADQGRFSLVTLFNIAYGYVPGRGARVALLAGCRALLEDGGRCLVSFAVSRGAHERAAPGWLRLAARVAGNPGWEPGDRLLGDGSFIHFFPDAAAAAAEARDAGFGRVEVRGPAEGTAYAVLAP